VNRGHEPALFDEEATDPGSTQAGVRVLRRVWPSPPVFVGRLGHATH